MSLAFGSLFTGIGGLDLGLERAGMTCRWQCEIDPYATRVLEKHWPDVKRYSDVRTITEAEPVDLICGGFPCQGISYAGRGGGLADARSGLFFELIRVVREVRPRIVLLENSAALAVRGLGRVLGELAALGFDAEWDCISAAALGAAHERDRIWIVATDPNAFDGCSRMGIFADNQAAILAARDRNRASVWMAPPCVPSRVGHGDACWLDRRQRTEVIGNAVAVPVAEAIGRMIVDACK